MSFFPGRTGSRVEKINHLLNLFFFNKSHQKIRLGGLGIVAIKNQFHSKIKMVQDDDGIHQISCEKVFKMRKDFLANSRNLLASHACTKMDPIEVCFSRARLENHDTAHVFTHKLEQEGKPVTNQKSSGRCWIFAFFNVMRIPFMKQKNLDEFEFSYSYLFFFDKIERCNFFLNNIYLTHKRGESVDGRLVSFLLHDPNPDGGQWDMIVNLVNKYGVMPKRCFPESFSSESSGRLNSILRSKLRECCKEIRTYMDDKKSDSAVQELISSQMSQIYQIVATCLGIPKDNFVWEYYDKSKVYHKIGPITPLAFYEEHVKPYFNVDNKICLVNDPRPQNPYGKLYTVDCLGNIVGGRKTTYNNQPIEILINAASDSIKGGEGVWIGCEVTKRFAAKQGIQDLDIHDYGSLFGFDIILGMTKSERLEYGESAMSHAMMCTAFSQDENNSITKWRIENSWGEEKGEKGYILMSGEWFKEFVFEIVVDKSFVSKEVLDVYEQKEIKMLPAWDPMGVLAKFF